MGRVDATTHITRMKNTIFDIQGAIEVSVKQSMGIFISAKKPRLPVAVCVQIAQPEPTA
jgi:hypothetical protein